MRCSDPNRTLSLGIYTASNEFRRSELTSELTSKQKRAKIWHTHTHYM
jgi:hypothetical protein